MLWNSCGFAVYDFESGFESVDVCIMHMHVDVCIMDWTWSQHILWMGGILVIFAADQMPYLK